MTKLYEFGNNTFGTTGMPWIQSIESGLIEPPRCEVCDGGRSFLSGDLLVELEKDKARLWPDIIGCGDYPALVISDSFVSACSEAGIEIAIGGVVQIAEPLENGLAIEDSPQYRWVDGAHHFGAKVDFEASGFVDNHFCLECGRRMDNVCATYDRQHATPPPPMVFVEGSYTGLDLFTTDISPTAFFCTQKVVDCASRYRLTNCRFTELA